MTVFKSNVSKGYYMTVDLTTQSQDRVNNYSIISYVVSFCNGGTRFDHRVSNSYVKLNGQVVWNISNGSTFSSPSGYTSCAVLKSGTLKVQHDSSGDAKVDISSNFSVKNTGYYSPSAALKISDTYAISQINRLATAIVPSNVWSNEQLKFTVNISNSTFTAKAYVEFKGVNVSGTKSVVNGSNYFSLDENLISKQIPDTTEGRAKLVLQTFKGTTVIGSNSYYFDILLNRALSPEITGFVISDTKRLSVGYVENVSMYDVSAYVKLKGNANLGSYYWQFGTQTSTSSNPTFKSERGTSVNLKLTFKDSRGRTVTKTQTITQKDYFEPRISVFKATRYSSTQKQYDGEYVRFDIKANTVDYATIRKAEVLYHTVGQTNWSSLWSNSYQSSNMNLTNSDLGNGLRFLNSTSYEFMVKITDNFGTESSKIVKVDKIQMPLTIGKNGIGVNRLPSTEGGIATDKLIVDGYSINKFATYSSPTRVDTKNGIRDIYGIEDIGAVTYPNYLGNGGFSNPMTIRFNPSLSGIRYIDCCIIKCSGVGMVVHIIDYGSNYFKIRVYNPYGHSETSNFAISYHIRGRI